MKKSCCTCVVVDRRFALRTVKRLWIAQKKKRTTELLCCSNRYCEHGWQSFSKATRSSTKLDIDAVACVFFLTHAKHAIIDQTERELELIRGIERELRHKLINMDVQERKLAREVN